MTGWRRVLSYLGPHRAALALAALASVAYALLDAFSIVVLIPFLGAVFGAGGGGGDAAGEPGRIERVLDVTVGRFIDLDGDPQTAVAGIIAFILVLVVLKNAADFARSCLSARVEQGVTRDLRNRVYGHLLELDLAFFERVRTGQIVSRLTHDVEQLRTLVTAELIRALSWALVFSATLYWMLVVSVRLTVAAFIVVPLTMVIWGPLIRRLRRGDREVLDMAGEVSSHIQETVSGIRMVKSAAAEPRERERFLKLTTGYFDTFLRTVRIRALAGPLTEVFVALGTAILLWYGARMVVVGGTLTAEAFVGFIFLSTKLYAPVKYLSKLPTLIQPGLVGAERIFEFLDAPAGIRDREGARPFSGVGAGIRYRGVHMEYRAGAPVLEDVDFLVPAGAVVALVGPSGAGKTTIVDLLARFYDPTGGAVEIDGTDIRDLRVASLRGGARGGVAGHGPLPRHGARQHRLREGRRHAGGGRGRGPRGTRARLRCGPSRRLRHRSGRAGHHAVGGTAAAHRDRTGRPARSPHPGPRRGHQRARHRIGAGRAGCDGGAARGPHRLRNRAPAVDDSGARTGSWWSTGGESCSGGRTTSSWRKAGCTAGCGSCSSGEGARRVEALAARAGVRRPARRDRGVQGGAGGGGGPAGGRVGVGGGAGVAAALGCGHAAAAHGLSGGGRGVAAAGRPPFVRALLRGGGGDVPAGGRPPGRDPGADPPERRGGADGGGAGGAGGDAGERPPGQLGGGDRRGVGGADTPWTSWRRGSETFSSTAT